MIAEYDFIPIKAASLGRLAGWTAHDLQEERPRRNGLPGCIVTLTTDFGLSDHFAGVMKAVILGINPAATLVDLTHEVPCFDILEASYTLAQGYPYFPVGTIHLVVVDPGVGGARRPILAVTSGASFVAPDNGVLSMVYAREPQVEVREIEVQRYALKPTSSTFHGRDLFAPVAAWLSRGVPPCEFGSLITDYVQVPVPRPRRLGAHAVEGVVLKVDRFGNLITNLAPEDLPEMFGSPPRPFRIAMPGDPEPDPLRPPIERLVHSFSEGRPGEPFAIVGSSGFLEIGINQGSAAEALHAQRNSRIVVEFAL